MSRNIYIWFIKCDEFIGGVLVWGFDKVWKKEIKFLFVDYKLIF